MRPAWVAMPTSCLGAAQVTRQAVLMKEAVGRRDAEIAKLQAQLATSSEDLAALRKSIGVRMLRG